MFIDLNEEITVNSDTIAKVYKSEVGDYSIASYYDKIIVIVFKDGETAKLHFKEDEEKRDTEYLRIVGKLHRND